MENTQCSDFLIDDVIHDIIYLIDLGNKNKVANFIIFQKVMLFYNNLMLYLFNQT